MNETNVSEAIQAGPPAGQSRPAASPRVAFWTALVSGFSLASICLIGYGLPLDAWTWCGVGLGMVPVVAAWRRDSYFFVAVIFYYYLTFAFPLERHRLQDVHGGRIGWQIEPHGFRFGYAGPNTRLLEKELGPLDAQWQDSGITFMLLATWRDGNERVNCHNLIFSSRLPAILERLPTDAARRRVLACLTDSTNLLRIHQGFLLTCLDELGYPPGMNAQTWWDRHEWIFEREQDAGRAVRTVWGWSSRWPEETNWTIVSQLHGVNFQQRGTWGGDADFGEEFQEFDDRMRRDGDKNDARLGVNRIVWWNR